MESNAKRSQLGAAVDRISILPRNIVDLILQRLLIHDVARTSVLSKTWKKIWGSHPQLVFGEKFYSQLVPKDDIQAKLYTFSKTISNILLLHSGPISKFQLSIPRDLPLNHSHDMDIWIKYISNNGVKTLEFFNNPPVSYNVPSYLFSCLELTDLWLINCTLNPPLKFGGFCNLNSVKLLNVTVTADMSFGSQLKQLFLKKCTGLEHLGCQFNDNNNLTALKVYDCGEFNWKWSEFTKDVQILGLMLNNVPYSAERLISFDKLVGNMPKISVLRLDGFFLKALKPVAANVNMLGTTTVNLKSLYLYRIRFDGLAQIKNVLCLIKRSPNLQYLHIQLEVTTMEIVLREATDPVVLKSVKEYLQSPDVSSLVLDKLQTVKLVGMMGTETQLHFINFLLASSPSLKWMRLSSNSAINDLKEVYRISRELMRFPRASTAAQIIWT